MALLRIPEQDRTLTESGEIATYLSERGIDYERLEGAVPTAPSSEALLAAYADKIDALKARGGYVVADVIDVSAETPGPRRDAQATSAASTGTTRTKFVSSPKGAGCSTSIPRTAPCSRSRSRAGDLIRVPRGTHHWFDLCGDRRIRAIRLFQDKSGWTPHYTESGVDSQFQPLCFGPSYLPPTRIDPGISV